jgi:mannosyltransferase OCH1-like enzyme
LKIYQTWETKDLPEKMRECVERLKSKNPDFEHHLFDANDRIEFIKTHFDADVLKAYNKIIPGAFKADLWRYCVLYINGGVYLDIKYSNVDDFNLIEFANDEYFIRDIKDSGGGVYNACMICKPGNKILREAIDKIVENARNEHYGNSCLYPTGPMLLVSCFKQEDLLKMDSNGLGICKHNENTSICLKGKPILTVYDEYYKQDLNKNGQKHYNDLWVDKAIYDKTMPM